MVTNLKSRLRGIKRTGFTLIEVMTAVAITGIIGVALTTSIFQVMTVQSATKNRTDAVKQVENALHYVNQDAQMGAPRQTATNNTANHFYLTSLTSAVAIGNTSLTVVNSTGFVAPGSVVVGTGIDAEVINYSAKNGNVLTISPAAKTHPAIAAVANAMAFKWTDNSGSNHVVAYALTTTNGVQVLQRYETVGAGQPTGLRLAEAIDSTNSFYTFDGKLLTVNLTAAVSGLRSASETRTLVVQLRPTF